MSLTEPVPKTKAGRPASDRQSDWRHVVKIMRVSAWVVVMVAAATSVFLANLRAQQPGGAGSLAASMLARSIQMAESLDVSISRDGSASGSIRLSR